MPTSTPDRGLTWRESARAARTVLAAEHGRRARAAVRPRTSRGLVRDRAPLAVGLYAASRDGRLIRQGHDGFALLEPPLSRTPAPRWRGLAHAVVDRVDRNWGAVVLGTPPTLALLTATALALIPGTGLVALVPVLFTMVHVAVLLTAPLVLALLPRRAPGPDATRLSLLSGTHWTMTLFHQGNDQRVDELFDRVRERLRHLLTTELTATGRQQGTAADNVRVTESLVCLHDGVTTTRAQDLITARHPGTTWGDGADFSVARFDQHPDDAPRVPNPPLAFVRLYLWANVIVVLGLALLVSGQERAACLDRPCANAPTEYWDALIWTAYQLVWRQPPGTEAVSGFAAVIGWLLSPLLPLLLLVSFVAYRRHRRYLDHIRRTNGRTPMSTRLLVVTVTPEERDAVIDSFDRYTDNESTPDFRRGRVPTVRLGEIADTEVFLIQVPTAGGVGASTVSQVAADVIRDLKPHCAIITGICYGLKPVEQELGDVLVSAVIRDLDHAKLTDVDGRVVRQDRSERVAPSPVLHTAAIAAQRQWQRQSGLRVRFGEILSWNKLVNSELVVTDLRERYPDAIGADMEGAAFYAVTRWAGVESILIKSICDWADGTKDDSHHVVAAANAAGFVLHLVRVGAITVGHRC
ncbi:hypothetical protein ABZ816_40000 [Actinosynnema sp. NPDC047251]|uniref:5'-methylthioadenosine/S-adenosylhomocysteine nucleosidase family protein n=1 Tax=Saccharothrix espanaensis TaxID=103731 RepID=UPI00030C254D|nr:hypothetical protein [Saccharothrix espanaensis]